MFRLCGIFVCILVLAACTQLDPKTTGASSSDPQVANASDPAATAVVYRDDWGVPHIYAGSQEAGFYGLGYAQAEDRPQRTLFLFLFSRGEVASVMGEDFLALDLSNRLWRHREMGEKGVERLSPQLRKNYEAYLAGINAYFDENPDQAPAFGFEPDLADILALERSPFFFGYQGTYAKAECQADGWSYTEDLMPAQSGLDVNASNGWAVMPERTADGALILGSDPHVENASPFYYEFRMDAGPIKSAGFALGPILWQTHTANVAWAMTTGGPDVVDCYEIETDPENPRRYLYDGEWQDMVVRQETFNVAGSEPVVREFEYTLHNGVLSPILKREDGKAYAASAPAMDQAGLLSEEIYAMNRARDIQGVKKAMATGAMFQQNLTVGDRKGNLWYVRAGATSIRPDGYDWARPVPGNTSDTAWQGFHKLEDLVQVDNPKAGYLQNNNVSPDVMVPESPINNADYPDYIFNDRPGRQTSRGARAIQVLSANDRMTMADALALSMDEKWITADDWIAALRYAVDTDGEFVTAQPDTFAAVLDRLLAFDGYARAESQAAAAFYFWRRNIEIANLAGDFELLRRWPMDREKFTAEFAQVLLELLQKSAENMLKAHGTVDITLGDLFYAGRTGNGWPVGGLTLGNDTNPTCVGHLSPICERTMRAFQAAPPDGPDAQRILRGSQSMRLVAFTDPLQSFTLYGFGQSDDPASPHFNDQAKLFFEKRMKPTYFYRNELESHIESEKTLTMPSELLN